MRGTSVTVVPGAGPADPVVGPTGTPLIGRVPEACRRQLGLPTPPAPPIEISTIVDLWLARAAMAAMHGDDVGWSDVLSMLPSGPPRAPTPADAAAALHQAVAHWSWEQVRGRVARGATHLVAGCADATAAAWMDTGMFGRWVVGELPPSGVLLEVLDALTSPATVERIRAARRLAANAGSR